MDKRLYRLPIPGAALTRSNTSQSRRVAASGTLSDGPGVVTPISTDPGKIVLDGQLRGKYAGLMATEIEELFSSDIDTVPYHGIDGAASTDGYYALENVGVGPLDPRADSIQEFDGVLRFSGTRSSHFRELSVEPTLTDYPESNTESCLVGVPGSASQVQWYHPETEATESATPTGTVSSEFGEIDVYDAAPGVVPFSGASLVYDVPYADAGGRDVKIWDDHDREKFDAEGYCSWQRVFITAHDPSGTLVLDNALVRVHLDTQNGIGVEQWDSSTSAWTQISFSDPGWNLHSVDVRSLSPVRTQARLIFTDGSSEYPLDAVLHRGRQRLQLDRVQDAPVPSGLEDCLSSLADSSLYDPGSGLGLRDREEVSE